MGMSGFDLEGAAAEVARAVMRARWDAQSLVVELQDAAGNAREGYERGAVDALLAVLECARGREPYEPSDVPLERGSLAARLLLEIRAGVQGANVDLAERLGTDKTQLSRAGRRLRQLGLADRVRDGRINRWSLTQEGAELSDRLRLQS